MSIHPQPSSSSEYDYVTALVCEPGWLPRLLDTGIFPSFLHHEKGVAFITAITWLYKTKQDIHLDNLTDQLNWQYEYHQANATAMKQEGRRYQHKMLRQLLQDTVSDAGIEALQLERRMAAIVKQLSQQLLLPEWKEYIYVDHFGSLQQSATMNTLTTGIKSLDEATRGMQPGSLWLLVSAPSVGCSALAFSICLHALSQEQQVMIVALHHNKQEVTTRLLSIHSTIPLHKIQDAQDMLSTAERATLYEAYESLPLEKCTISDTNFDTQESLLQYMSDTIASTKATLVLLDGWHWLYPHADGQMLQRNTALLEALKKMAMDTATCIVCTARLKIERKDVPLDENNEPVSPSRFLYNCQLEDLTNSQLPVGVCDVVVGLYRPAYYSIELGAEEANRSYLTLLRNQYGPTYLIAMRPLLHLYTWKEWTDDEPEEDFMFDEDELI
ncbi:DnaB-like helicase C-terminal domain-containing protein [Phnomibacter sp. MR]|uniref:DnaB-like helicase C-terminal domain-containing protein n=1 Tax=Phnomibacter sp. MR TaxID=3042318 RepID=UPI003A8081D2